MTEPKSRRPLIVAGLSAVGVLAVGGAGLALFPPTHKTAVAQVVESASVPSQPDVPPNVPPTAMPSLEPEPGLTLVPPAQPRSTEPTAPRQATRPTGSPPPLPQKPVGIHTASPKPGVSYQEGVLANEACAPKDAVGHTADGTLLTCARVPNGSQTRWRLVIAPPPIR